MAYETTTQFRQNKVYFFSHKIRGSTTKRLNQWAPGFSRGSGEIGGIRRAILGKLDWIFFTLSFFLAFMIQPLLIFTFYGTM